jgi:DNA polymerase III alpha subunit (gram-positive type)
MTKVSRISTLQEIRAERERLKQKENRIKMELHSSVSNLAGHTRFKALNLFVKNRDIVNYGITAFALVDGLKKLRKLKEKDVTLSDLSYLGGLLTKVIGYYKNATT